MNEEWIPKNDVTEEELEEKFSVLKLSVRKSGYALRSVTRLCPGASDIRD